MCLDLKENAKLKIAEEDIICYKRLKISQMYNMSYEELDGKPFTGKCLDEDVNGVISIDDGNLYFCTNDSLFDGLACTNKYGYKYSWSDSCCIDRIIVNEHKLVKVKGYRTPYRYYPIIIGKIYTSLLLHNEYTCTITKGLHSFTNQLDAQNDGDGVVAKCIIPKGSAYYEGYFDNKKSYASNCIKYLEIVTDYEE